MRRAASALLLLAAAAGCGSGSPTSPGTPATVSLEAGRHTLRIFTKTTTHLGPAGERFEAWVCVGIGIRPDGASVSLPVDVERDGEGWTVRVVPDGALWMRLADTPGSLHGTLEGQASAGDVTVTIGDSPQHFSPATVSGAAGSWSFEGDISGHVTFSRGGGSQSCSSNGWSLVRQ